MHRECMLLMPSSGWEENIAHWCEDYFVVFFLASVSKTKPCSVSFCFVMLFFFLKPYRITASHGVPLIHTNTRCVKQFIVLGCFAYQQWNAILQYATQENPWLKYCLISLREQHEWAAQRAAEGKLMDAVLQQQAMQTPRTRAKQAAQVWWEQPATAVLWSPGKPVVIKQFKTKSGTEVSRAGSRSAKYKANTGITTT